MQEIKFPRRRPDQSFQVTAHFRTSKSRVKSLVPDYVEKWVRENSTKLGLRSEFQSEPHVEFGPGDYTFSIIFHGRPDATKYWKDCMVFLLHEMSKTFPEIKFEKFES